MASAFLIALGCNETSTDGFRLTFVVEEAAVARLDGFETVVSREGGFSRLAPTTSRGVSFRTEDHDDDGEIDAVLTWSTDFAFSHEFSVIFGLGDADPFSATIVARALDANETIAYGTRDVVLRAGGEERLEVTCVQPNCEASPCQEICDNELNCDAPLQPQLAWVRQDGGKNGDLARRVKTLEDGSAYVAGESLGGTFGEGEQQLVLDAKHRVDGFLARYSRTGQLEWVQSVSGLSHHDSARALARLEDDSIIVVGNFAVTTTFGQGDQAVELTAVGFPSAFVARFSANGELLWVRDVRGVSRSFAVAATESIMLGGYLFSTSTFGAEEDNEIVLTQSGDNSGFIASYTKEGNLQWAKLVATGSSSVVRALAPSDEGGTFVSGEFRDLVTFGEGTATEVLTSVGADDVFVARYSEAGALEWVRRAGGTGADLANDMAQHPKGVVVAGDFLATADFATTTLISAGLTDAFLAMYDEHGDLAWARRSGGALSNDRARGVSSGASGEIFVTGAFGDSATFGSGEAQQTVLTAAGLDDAFFAAYQPNGDLSFAERAGGELDDDGLAIAVAQDGSVYWAGRFSSTAARFGEGTGDTTLFSRGGPDMFLSRYVFADVGCDDDGDDYCDSNLEKAEGIVVDVCPGTDADAAQGDDCDDESASVTPPCK